MFMLSIFLKVMPFLFVYLESNTVLEPFLFSKAGSICYHKCLSPANNLNLNKIDSCPLRLITEEPLGITSYTQLGGVIPRCDSDRN